jgi:hypothetical protein
MSYRITNRRPGPIVLAGSRLHLDPGKSVEVEELSADLLLAAGKGLVEIADLSAVVSENPEPMPKAPPEQPLPKVVPPPTPPSAATKTAKPSTPSLAAKKPAKPSSAPTKPEPKKNNFSLLKEKLALEESREVLETMLAGEQRKPYVAMIKKRLKELEGALS